MSRWSLSAWENEKSGEYSSRERPGSVLSDTTSVTASSSMFCDESSIGTPLNSSLTPSWPTIWRRSMRNLSRLKLTTMTPRSIPP